MNAEQLNGILARLHDTHRQLQTMEKLQAVRGSLETLSGSPADANIQNQYTAHLQQLNDVLVLPPLNNFTVREAKLIEELGLDLLVGEHLRAEISAAVLGVTMTPRVALDAVVALHDKAVAALKRVGRVSTDLSELGVDQGGPKPEEIELGLYIPRDGGNLTLDQLLEEGAELDELVKLAYEAVEGKPQSGQVSYLTSCDYGYLLTIAPGVVWFLMCLIEKALDIRKKWREDRDHFARSRELGHDEDSIKALETKQEAVRQRELADAVRVIVHEQSGVDEGRKNELTTLLTKRIEVFVEKHERGSYIDVRVGTQPKVPDQAEGVADSPEIIQLREKAALLQRIEQSSMRIHALEQNKEVAVKSIEPPRPRRKKG